LPKGEPPNAEEVGLTLYPKTNARRDEYKGNQEGNLGADGTRCCSGSSVATLPERGAAYDRWHGGWPRAGEPAGATVFP